LNTFAVNNFSNAFVARGLGSTLLRAFPVNGATFAVVELCGSFFYAEEQRAVDGWLVRVAMSLVWSHRQAIKSCFLVYVQLCFRITMLEMLSSKIWCRLEEQI